MDPVTAAHLRAIGLPYGPNTNPALAGPRAMPADAASTSMGLNAALNASPLTNGSQNAPVAPQAPAQPQQDSADIFSSMAPEQGNFSTALQAAGTGGAAWARQRLQAAQSAMEPTPTPDAMSLPADAMPTAEQAKAATPGMGAAVGAALPAFGQSDVSRRLAAAQVAAAAQAPEAPNPGPQVPPEAGPQAPSDSAASGRSPQVPVAAPGGPSGAPQAPPATTLAVSSNTMPTPPPGPATAPVESPKGPVTPELIANAIYGQESSYGANTKTSSTGARGGMQIEPQTWAQYAQPGENIDNPTDNRNVGNRIVQDLYQKSGGDPARVAVGYFSGPKNIAPPGSPTPWLEDKSDGHTTVSQYVAGILGKLGQPVPTGSGGWQAGGGTGRNSPPGTYSGIDAIHQGSAIGIDPKEMMSLAQSLGYKPIDTEAFNNRNLIAMGMAMMGGRTFADSMKNGAGVMNDSNNALLGVQEKQNSNALQMAQIGINAKRADAQLANEKARLAALDRDRPLGPPTLQADGTYGVTMQTPTTGAIHVVPVGTPTSVVNSDPNRKADTTLAVDAAKEQVKLRAGASEDEGALQNIASARNVVQQHPELLGPTLGAQAKRYMATSLGFGDTATLQAFEKMSAEGRMNYLQDATGGHVGGIRSNAELENIGKAVTSAQTDPKAADYLLGIQQRDIEARKALRATLDQNANKPEWQGKNYLSSQSNFLTNYIAQHPVIWDNGHGTQPALDLSKYWTK